MYTYFLSLSRDYLMAINNSLALIGVAYNHSLDEEAVIGGAYNHSLGEEAVKRFTGWEPFHLRIIFGMRKALSIMPV